MPATPTTVHTARLHVRALVLSAALLGIFTVAVGLYARYGYGFVLRVYEQQQLANAERRTGARQLVDYEDYLRVDPGHLRMRGLFINLLIDINLRPRALETAMEGIAVASTDQQPIAKLLLARALLANGDLAAAKATYNEALAKLGSSVEAYFGLAHIAAAEANFEQMNLGFEQCTKILLGQTPSVDAGQITIGYIGPISRNAGFSTPDFAESIWAATDYVERPTWWLLRGDIDRLFKEFSTTAAPNDVTREELFWRGVYEEEQGHREAALDFYQRAADAGDALGKYAVTRLNPPPVEAKADTKE